MTCSGSILHMNLYIEVEQYYFTKSKVDTLREPSKPIYLAPDIEQ